MRETEAKDSPSVLPVLDPKKGVELSYGLPDVWEEALSLFYELLPGYATDIRAACLAADRERLRGVIHSLSGASGYCGTLAVNAASKRLEALCLAEPVAALHGKVDEVLAQIDRLLRIREAGALPSAGSPPIY